MVLLGSDLFFMILTTYAWCLALEKFVFGFFLDTACWPRIVQYIDNMIH